VAPQHFGHSHFPEQPLHLGKDSFKSSIVVIMLAQIVKRLVNGILDLFNRKNLDSSVACFCYQVAPWDPNMFWNFYFVTDLKIAFSQLLLLLCCTELVLEFQKKLVHV
jgi:hypothetical protein